MDRTILHDVPKDKKEYDHCSTDNHCSGFSYAELKEEAIKWINATQVHYYQQDRTTETGVLNTVRDLAVEAWIKHFFNITEEDLK